jgi:[CysO sulfur-carrier protein]-S-L-cysteine hydrolase
MNKLVIGKKMTDSIIRHVLACLPEEACGIIGGVNETAKVVIPIRNELHSQTRFRMDPVEQYRAFKTLEENKHDLLAIYHSHPKGPGHPSETDQNEFAYPGCLYVIIFPQENGWQMKSFSLDEQTREIPCILKK